MKLRSRLMLFLCVLSFGFASHAKADNTATVTVTPTSITASGKVCAGSTIIVENNSGGPIKVVVLDGDGTEIINEVIADGDSVSGTLNAIGTGSACASDSPLRIDDCVNLEITAPCIGIPTLSEWAVVTMTLLLLVGGTVIFRKVAVAA